MPKKTKAEKEAEQRRSSEHVVRTANSILADQRDGKLDFVQTDFLLSRLFEHRSGNIPPCGPFVHAGLKVVEYEMEIDKLYPALKKEPWA